MKNTFRKLTTLVLALLFTASLPLTALAETLELNISNGSIGIFDDHATQNDTHHSHSGTVIVTGSSTENNVSVEVSQSVTVVLDSVNIDTADSSGAAVDVNTQSSEAVVTVELNGTNTLASDIGHAGLEVSGSGQLVIQDKVSLVEGELVDTSDGGSLTATGGNAGAGIGSKIYSDAQNITITGGTINATGGQSAAGIGAGDGGNASNITITGGTVKANGGTGAAGIGGGEGDSRYSYNGDADNITITGGNVTAEGGSGGAGIGSGAQGEADSIIITNGTVKATGGQQAAGIGSGQFGDAGSITVTDGTVTATGGYQAAGIGGGDYGSVYSVAISGGTVTATGGPQAAGIGGEITEDTKITFSGDAKVTAIGGENAVNVGDSEKKESVEPDISALSTEGWYQAGENGEKIYGSVGTGTSAAANASHTQNSWFRVNARWSKSIKDGILTVTSDKEDATLTIRGWGIQGLRKNGIHTLVFVTAQAETTLDIAKLAEECAGADSYVITHTGTEAVLTLNGKTE